MSEETNLVLGDLIIPVGAGRGIVQTLGILDNGDLRRTVNGSLVDTTRAVNQKFVSSIRCTDMDAPTMAQVWKGSELDVECVSKIRQVVTPASDTVTLIRFPVETSIVGYTSLGVKLEGEIVSEGERVVMFDDPVVRVDFRPILTMLVTDKSEDEDEYGAVTSWTIDLEEV